LYSHCSGNTQWDVFIRNSLSVEASAISLSLTSVICIEKYEFIIIGIVSGYAIALRCIYFGKRMCLRKRVCIGEAGVYNGTLSSSTMWELSNLDSDINEMIISKERSKFELTWEDVKQNIAEAIFECKFQYSVSIKLFKNKIKRS